MNAATQNIAISLVAMQLARRINLDDPIILNYVRLAYVAVQLIALGVHYYISSVVKRKNDKTVLKYVEAPPPMSEDKGKLVKTTVRDYDLGEIQKAIRSVLMGIAMMGVMHIYFKYTQPLFIQSLMGLKTLYDSKLVAIHILGKPAEGDLKRPFVTPGLFGMSAPGPSTDPAQIEEAEKREAAAASKKAD